VVTRPRQGREKGNPMVEREKKEKKRSAAKTSPAGVTVKDLITRDCPIRLTALFSLKREGGSTQA